MAAPPLRPRPLRRALLGLGLLLHAERGAAADVCRALGSGTWGPVDGGSVVWNCGTGAPGPDDAFVVPAGVTVSLEADVAQAGNFSAGITVEAGGVLEAIVSEATGPLALVLGPAGLWCRAGATCRFRGGYRPLRAAGPAIDAVLSDEDVFPVGDLVPCDGDAGSGPVADCAGAAAIPGDPASVRFDYADSRFPPALFAPALSGVDAARDVACFFLPDAQRGGEGYVSAELNQCYDVTAAGPDFLRLDVTQSVRDQPGHPLTRKGIHEAALAADVATGDRQVRLATGTLDADERFAARWLVFEDATGRPEPRPWRILSTRIEAGGDAFLLGDRRGAPRAHAAGERVWISYGWTPGDPFVVMAPVRITSATANPDDTLLVVGDATVEMEAVWLDDLRRVDARGNGQHRYTRVWFRDPTPGQVGGPIDYHAFHVDHNAATAGSFEFRQVNVTGGDHRTGVCGTSFADPCVHDAIHWANTTHLIVEDLAARYLGNGCFPAHGGDKSGIGIVLRRLSCEFTVDDARAGDIFNFANGPSSALVEDVFCGDCGQVGDPVMTGVGPGGSLDLDGLTVWASRSLRMQVGEENATRNVLVAGGSFTGLARLPSRVDGFAVHDLRQVDTQAPDFVHAASNDVRNGVFRDLALRSFSLGQPGGRTQLENVAILDPRTTHLGSGRTVLRWLVAPDTAALRRVLVWFPAGSTPGWQHAVTLALTPVAFELDGLFVAHANAGFQAGLALTATQVQATSFGAPPCFWDDAQSVLAGTEALYPAATLWNAAASFTDEDAGNLLPRPGSPAAAAGCGLDSERPPGLRGRRFGHWLTKTRPELVGEDRDGDGIAEVPGLPACAGSIAAGCTDNCPASPNPWQQDADGDGAGDACEPACANGRDDDGDGFADLSDPECAGGADESEETLLGCADGLDQDGDGLVDLADPGCTSAADDLETSALLPCDDGVDDDGDLWIDDADPGCTFAGVSEDPACDDGRDNDGDGFIDGDDPTCVPGSVGRESRRSCGLGFELAAVLVGLGRSRRWRCGSARR